MSEHFNKIMSKKSDAELLALAANFQDYGVEALTAVLEQMKARGIESKSKELIIGFLDSHAQKETKEKEENPMTIPTDLHPNVKLASNLLFATIPFGIINYFITPDVTGMSGSKIFIIGLLSWFIIGALAYWLRSGTKISRNVLVVIMAIGLGPSLYSLPGIFRIEIVSGIISICINALNIYGLVLLFKDETRDWYDGDLYEPSNDSL